jgi:hypothetical protein
MAVQTAVQAAQVATSVGQSFLHSAILSGMTDRAAELGHRRRSHRVAGACFDCPARAQLLLQSD